VAEVNTIAVIGAGTMGRGIAHVAALGGYQTVLEDLLPNALRRAENEIRGNLDKAIELGKVSADDAKAALGRLRYAGSVEEAAREADLVIEAVPEEMESKIEIFTLLDKICRPGTILASNTSSLSITEIASVSYRPQKCVGMHFFNPVHKMKLLEIVRGLETDEDTLATAAEVGRRRAKNIRDHPAHPSRAARVTTSCTVSPRARRKSRASRGVSASMVPLTADALSLTAR